MNCKLAYHGITWGSQPHEFLQYIDDVARLEIFQGLEVFLPVCDYYTDKPAEFDRLLKERNLKLACLYGGGTFWDEATQKKEIEDNRKIIRFLARHGADRMIFGPGRKRNGGMRADDFEQMADIMNRLGEEALSMGIQCGIHPHLGTSIESRYEIEKILEYIDPDYVFLAPDTAHLHGAGINPVEFFKTHIDKIIYVHVKDWSGKNTFDGIMTSHTDKLPCFCELGEGEVELPAIFQVLKENQYSGWLTVELDQSLRTPFESATINRDYLKKYLF